MVAAAGGLTFQGRAVSYDACSFIPISGRVVALRGDRARRDAGRGALHVRRLRALSMRPVRRGRGLPGPSAGPVRPPARRQGVADGAARRGGAGRRRAARRDRGRVARHGSAGRLRRVRGRARAVRLVGRLVVLGAQSAHVRRRRPAPRLLPRPGHRLHASGLPAQPAPGRGSLPARPRADRRRHGRPGGRGPFRGAATLVLPRPAASVRSRHSRARHGHPRARPRAAPASGRRRRGRARGRVCRRRRALPSVVVAEAPGGRRAPGRLAGGRGRVDQARRSADRRARACWRSPRAKPSRATGPRGDA